MLGAADAGGGWQAAIAAPLAWAVVMFALASVRMRLEETTSGWA